MSIDKKKLKDTQGRYLTQSLFLEFNYTNDENPPEYAIYTLDDEDREYKGKTFFSLKKRFIEAGDPTEYTFARTWLYNWDHWEKIQGNKLFHPHIQKWRDELEVSLRSEGALSLIEEANDGNVAAAKWLADKGWDKKAVGRPKKKISPQEQAAYDNKEKELYGSIVTRMEDYK